MRADLANVRQWLARAIVLAYAALAGGAIVAFTWLSDRALHVFELIRLWQPLAPFLLTPAVCACVVWLTLRTFRACQAPDSAGDGRAGSRRDCG